MFFKLVLLVTFLILQVHFSTTFSDRVPRVPYDGYVDINGDQYYIKTDDYALRDNASATCKALKMQLITFETLEKWDIIQNWASSNGFFYDWFWIGAERVNSTDWRWEGSGHKITEHRWALNQPNLEWTAFPSICLDFTPVDGGWSDDYCGNYYGGIFCEPKNAVEINLP
ncbi:uncharacterized protein LOC132203096 [Neocloeon triangulifer]|uniref:uncharacterized protein LOC132203096 n=1 Tax=Neocloeon triangulifer TaxID=2078957 RepID=UPI00286F541A|nr:uncharacterized protein LOC132203096 [Neocloeon triangulifer]